MQGLGLKKKKLFVSCNLTLTSFLLKEIPTLKFYFHPSYSQSTWNMQETHIIWKKNIQRKYFNRPTYPIFSDYYMKQTISVFRPYIEMSKLETC